MQPMEQNDSIEGSNELEAATTNDLFERSPDKGAFLASQPIPKRGIFCYMAVVNRTPFK